MEDALSDEAFLQNWMGSPSTTATKSAQTSNSAVMAAPLSAIGRCNVVHEAPVVHEARARCVPAQSCDHSSANRANPAPAVSTDDCDDFLFLQNWMGSPSTTAKKSAQEYNSAAMAAPLSAAGRRNVVHEAPVFHEVPAPRTSLSVLPPVLSKHLDCPSDTVKQCPTTFSCSDMEQLTNGLDDAEDTDCVDEDVVDEDTGRTTDEQFKHYVCSQEVHHSLKNFACGKRCLFGGGCVGATQLQDYWALRDEFWGEEYTTAPTRSERAAKLKTLLTNAFTPALKTFSFRLQSGLFICEQALLKLLGLLQSRNRQPKAWMRYRKCLLNGQPFEDEVEKEILKSVKRATGQKCAKSRHAILFVKYMASMFSDTIPTDDGVRCIPFENTSQLYLDYVNYCRTTSVPFNSVAGKSTFFTAFASLTDIRLLGCKGSFQTCDVCNCANDLLNAKDIKFSKEQRDVVLKFKRLHLLQQAAERDEMERNRTLAQNEKVNGRYKYAFFLIDGMTKYTTNTPRYGHKLRTGKQDGSVLGTRVVGVEVVCGPIDEVFLYCIDDLVSGGANLMIEIQRQAFRDLSKRLAAINLDMPKGVFLQYDNCGENKNKEMFAYLSLLTAEKYFDEIYCNFLLVGHTHCSIDQYFGVISKVIGASVFIGSPLSLMHLLRQIGTRNLSHLRQSGSGNSTCKTPSIVKYIKVVYDFREAMKPYIRPLKYYQVPHNFKFRRVDDNLPISICQYRLFSTHSYLPAVPEGFYNTIDAVSKLCAEEIILKPFCVVGDQASLHASLYEALYDSKGELLSSTDLIAASGAQEALKIAAEMNNTFHDLTCRSIDQQYQRFTDEDKFGAEDDAIKERYSSRSAAISALNNFMCYNSAAETGFLCWLRDPKGDCVTELIDVKPGLLISASEVRTAVSNLEGSNDDEASDSDSPPDDDAVTSNETEPLSGGHHKDLKNKRKRARRENLMAQLLSNAGEMASVGRRVTAQILNGRFPLSEDDQFSYTKKMMSTSEKQFYAERTKKTDILRFHLQDLHDVDAFEWLPLVYPSREGLMRAEVEREEQRKRDGIMMQRTRDMLVPKKIDRKIGETIISGQTRQRKATPKVTEDVCCVSECTHKGVHECPECLTKAWHKCIPLKFCIELHGGDHTRHEHQILKSELEAAPYALAMKEYKVALAKRNKQNRIVRAAHTALIPQNFAPPQPESPDLSGPHAVADILAPVAESPAALQLDATSCDVSTVSISAPTENDSSTTLPRSKKQAALNASALMLQNIAPPQPEPPDLSSPHVIAGIPAPALPVAESPAALQLDATASVVVPDSTSMDSRRGRKKRTVTVEATAAANNCPAIIRCSRKRRHCPESNIPFSSRMPRLRFGCDPDAERILHPIIEHFFSTADNAKVDLKVKFIGALDYAQYRNYLPKLINMYGLTLDGFPTDIGDFSKESHRQRFLSDCYDALFM